MNKSIISGRLVRDPDVRLYGDNNEKKMSRYTLAVDRGIKPDPNNPEQQTADFISCVCYGRSADFADNYLRKGMKILIEGRIQTGRYTNKDGQTIYTTDVVVDRHEFCESKSSRGDEQGDPDPVAMAAQAAQARQATQAAQAASTATSATAPKQNQTHTEPFINIPDNIDMEVPFT